MKLKERKNKWCSLVIKNHANYRTVCSLFCDETKKVKRIIKKNSERVEWVHSYCCREVSNAIWWGHKGREERFRSLIDD